MSFFDWMGIASSVARLAGALASPEFVYCSLRHWHKGDIQRATLFAAYAILLVTP